MCTTSAIKARLVKLWALTRAHVHAREEQTSLTSHALVSASTSAAAMPSLQKRECNRTSTAASTQTNRLTSQKHRCHSTSADATTSTPGRASGHLVAGLTCMISSTQPSFSVHANTTARDTSCASWQAAASALKQRQCRRFKPEMLTVGFRASSSRCLGGCLGVCLA